MQRALAISIVLLACVIAPLTKSAPASAAGIIRTGDVIYLPMPASNSAASGAWTASDSRLVYTLSDPLMVPPYDPNRGGTSVNFRTAVYSVNLNFRNGRLSASKPRIIFRAPKGLFLDLASVENGWLVYEQHDPVVGGHWQIIARNVDSSARVVLDSRAREGVPSLTPPPASDGRTVVWQTWTKVAGKTTSVVRTYDLRSGHRGAAVAGGSMSTWGYFGAAVSGSRVIFSKELYATHHTQIMLMNLTTGQVKALTPTSASFSEPWISGDVAVWKVGQRFSNGAGVTVADLRTNTRRFLSGYNAEAPRASGNRYVVYSAGSKPSIKLYDTHTGRFRTLVPVNDKGYGVGNHVAAAQHMVLYQQGKPCGDPNFVCPGRLAAVRLP